MTAAGSGGFGGEPRRGSPIRRRIELAARLVTALTAAATVLAALARSGWVADLASHFPWQYAGAALIAALALGVLRRTTWALAAAASFAFNLYAAWPAALPAVEAPRSQPLRVLVCNVFFGSSSHDRVIALARNAHPDAAVFVEVTPEWRRALEVLEDDLPHVRYAGKGRHGVLLMSRLPFEAPRVLKAAPDAEPALHVRLSAGPRRLDLFAVHANWPLGGYTTDLRNRQLRMLAQLASSADGPVVIAGDLNISPYSPHFRDLLKDGRLRSAAGRRWLPTWPTFFPPAAIQIDHVLVSPDVGVTAVETGALTGSDHLPLVADLVF
jgi:endonuclease/exonuclease/phosphatase (EEP) superfamily protein YafD